FAGAAAFFATAFLAGTLTAAFFAGAAAFLTGAAFFAAVFAGATLVTAAFPGAAVFAGFAAAGLTGCSTSTEAPTSSTPSAAAAFLRLFPGFASFLVARALRR